MQNFLKKLLVDLQLHGVFGVTPVGISSGTTTQIRSENRVRICNEYPTGDPGGPPAVTSVRTPRSF